jgi:lysozyme
MNRNILIILIVGIIAAMSAVIVFQADFVVLLKNKFGIDSAQTAEVNKTDDFRGEIYGIDVSHHQGKIDWENVRVWNGKKIEFVYIKATEGATFVDKSYQDNFNGANNNNMLVGAYHYFRTTSTIEEQFENFINNVDKTKQDLIPLIDVEEKKNWNNALFHKNLQAFLNLVEAHFGKKPMIYTVNSFYNLHLSGKYKSYYFLIGRYGKNPPNMRDKSNWTIWQFSETGSVNGITKPVDINVLNTKYKLADIRLKN